MTRAEFFAALQLSGYPTCYREFKSPPGSKPWVCWLETSADPEPSDDVTTVMIQTVHVELYTETKDPTAEAAIEGILTDLEIPFSKSETSLDKEACILIIYEMEVLFNG